MCPRKRKEDRKKPGPIPKDEMDLGFLRVRKPTEGQGWVHILCSLFAPEVTYTDAARLRLVEGISAISRPRWEKVCHLFISPYFVLLNIILSRFAFYVSAQEVFVLSALFVSPSIILRAPGKLGSKSHLKCKGYVCCYFHSFLLDTTFAHRSKLANETLPYRSTLNVRLEQWLP